MRKPLIGITTMDDQDHADYVGGQLTHPPRYGQNQTYVQAVTMAGGVPLLIPILADEADLRRIYDLLDGLLLPGGADVDPQYYGEAPHPTTYTMPQLDVLELKLTTWAIADRMPILAICRGMQVLNVALGGDLYQDIPSQVETSIHHAQRDDGLEMRHYAHEVAVAPHTYLARIAAAPRISVNSSHHQAIRRLAAPLQVSATADDGIIEGCDWIADDRFVHGIQCHPEYLWSDNSWAVRLFQDFIAASRSFKM